MNLPNKISLFRILMIPLIVILWVFPYAQFNIELSVVYIANYALPLKNIIVAALFMIASISDFLDGYIARSRNLVTTFGKFIDPIADKCLTTTLFILFASEGIIPVVCVLIMVWRDIIVDGMRLVAASKNVVMSAKILGKIKTVSQMFCIIFILLNNLPFELLGLPVADILLWFSTFISFLSGVEYYFQCRHFIWESK